MFQSALLFVSKKSYKFLRVNPSCSCISAKGILMAVDVAVDSGPKVQPF